MSIYRSPSPSPYAPPSPIPSPAMQAQPMSAPGGQIQPGTITYTTSTSPDGRLTYHPFKAVPVSYQTNAGIVSGIQWIPAEATSVVPSGAQPAGADFVSSWNRGGQNRDERALREWQKDEERRIHKEEKEASKRMKKEREREMRHARERDHGRSMSGNYSAVPSVAGSVGSGYSGTYSNPMNDLERRMDNVDLGRSRKGSVGDYSNRRRSTYTEAPVAGYPGGIQSPGSPYQSPMAPPSPVSTAANPGYAPAAGYHTSAYPPAAAGADPYQRASSPYHGAPGGYPEQAILSRSRAPSPIPGGITGPYGGNRSRAPSPIPGAMAGVGAYGARSRAASPIPGAMPYAPPRPLSRAASPLPGAAPLPYGAQPSFPQPTVPGRSPHIGNTPALGAAQFEQQQMLSPPDGFSRPANLAQSYTFFETMKIQDMDDFFENMPRMPMVLVPHDVYHEDWIRFIQDLAMAWSGKLPTSDQSRASRPSTITAELVDLWNNSFFVQRGVEVVLFKGRERRSGPAFGQVERNLPGFGNDSDSDSSDSQSSDSSNDSDDKYARGGAGYYPSYSSDSKRRKSERKAEKKRKEKEKKARRRARERERTYALYITCIAPRDGPLAPPY
ncbi:hypothetical protein BC834DRAFT_616728 [Gloeopeniophorella convolvens]|nr:hypothetical protein BC834DRAFT_616728 [Gloeopeniophorella convolvens]